MHIFKTLKQKLILYLILCTFLPAAAILFFITYMGTKIVKNQVSDELYGVAILLEANVKQFLYNKKQAASLLASDGYIRKELEAFNDNIQPLKSRQIELCRYLYDRCKLFDGLWSAILLDKNGAVIASSNNMHLDENWSDRPYYNRYKAEKYGQFVSDAYFPEEYPHGFIDFAAPATDGKDSVGFLGVVIMKFDKSVLDELTTGETIASRDAVVSASKDDKQKTGLKNITRKGATREAYLVNKDKHMVTASRFLTPPLLKLSVDTEAVNHSLSKKTVFSGTYKDYRNTPVMGLSMFIEEPGWALLVETDLDEALIPVKKLRYVALIAIGSGLGCLVILTTTFRTIKHILLIEDAIKNISKGDLHVEYDFQSDELGSRLSDLLKDLKEAQAQLVQSGKLAGIGELASGVAHEINNPLTAVMGHSLRLLRKAENNEVLKTMKELDPFRTELKIIADASARCKRITEGLLRFSRMSPELKVRSISINDVITDTLVLIEYNLKQKNIQLVKRLEDCSKYIKGDHNQLQQVFTNMINNAIHALPNGGSLTIAAREIDSPPPIKSRRSQADKYIEIEFTDTGCGIEKEHVSRIFEPFFTTKEPGKGTGLGLSISYSIIKDHGGWIDVKSTVGEGTTFLITLPAG